MQVVINKCYGGFGLSDKAYEMLIEKGWKASKYINGNLPKGVKISINDSKEMSMLGKYYCSWYGDEDRTNKDVIDVIKKLGTEANGRHAQLAVVDIPDGTDFTIEEYDGIEWIAEKHATWG